MMWEFKEWSAGSTSWSGNAYDVVATVTFTHTATSATHVTEMFYDTLNTWKFRFAGDKLGAWTYASVSSDTDLNGLTGGFTIDHNPNSDAMGFLTNDGNRFALQYGNGGETKGFPLNIYMNGEDYPEFVHNFTSDAIINNYLNDADQYGFNTVFVHVCNNWFDFGSLAYDTHTSVDPDPDTFVVLENIVSLARIKDMRVHLWAWGDESRKWTPIGVGGINGVPDQRIQRYIAARLGPIPGWTMNYGFDLTEWTTEAQVAAWALYLHNHFGWQHMLWARERYDSELDAKSYPDISNASGNPFTYDDAVTNLNTDLTRPHIWEERFWLLRSGIWTMEDTRRALWDYVFAGGIGAFWGFYLNKWEPPPYPNPEMLVTANRFLNCRFLLNMERAESLSDGHCLKSTTNLNYLFYKESTTTVQMDLSGMASSQSGIAVDTKLDYAEIDMGLRSATNQTWTAPYSSDWGIAIGDFPCGGGLRLSRTLGIPGMRLNGRNSW